MSDIVLSPAEQEANAAKLQAEAAKAQAEARKLSAEAESAERFARMKTLELLKAEEADAAMRASDEYNHVYRFDTMVDRGSVEKATRKLAEWHRLDPKCEIEIVFSSPGGAVIGGMELFDTISNLRATHSKVTTGCTGMAASMAGVLLMAGSHRYMTKQSWLMIHRAAFGTMGKSYEVEDMLLWVKRVEKRILDIFVSRSKLSAATIKRNWERKDWWITADEALELELIEEIRGG